MRKRSTLTQLLARYMDTTISGRVRAIRKEFDALKTEKLKMTIQIRELEKQVVQLGGLLRK